MRRHTVSWDRFDQIDPVWQLDEGSRVAVIGGGPAGSFSAIFLLDLARRAGFDLEVDIFEPRSFDRGGPAGCNHCGGIVSESLVQSLAAEGINLPPTVVQRGIESYLLHMDLGSVEIESAVSEQRIAAVYRGNGPRGGEDMPWDSFDGFLQGLAEKRGASIIHELVTSVDRSGERPVVRTMRGSDRAYDLVVVASGVNSNLTESLLSTSDNGDLETSRTYISEFKSDAETIRSRMGNSMHVFMVDVPGVEFAALVPKGDYITFAMLGHDIDTDLVNRFLDEPPV
jgi:flavin-dependent dehydrogenase